VIITISGTPGSGKSVVAESLAKKLGYKLYGAGDVRRKYALGQKMTLEELNRKSEKDPTSDHLVDDHMKKLGSEDNLVVNGRMAFKIIPESIKVFIDADVDVRAKRIFDAKRKEEHFAKVSDAKKSIQNRVKSDVKRYEKLYGVNPYDVSHYDLVVDSSNISIDEVVGQIYRFAMFKSNPSKRK
jgi:CMP/dCMP kinase